MNSDRGMQIGERMIKYKEGGERKQNGKEAERSEEQWETCRDGKEKNEAFPGRKDQRNKSRRALISLFSSFRRFSCDRDILRRASLQTLEDSAIFLCRTPLDLVPVQSCVSRVTIQPGFLSVKTSSFSKC